MRPLRSVSTPAGRVAKRKSVIASSRAPFEMGYLIIAQSMALNSESERRTCRTPGAGREPDALVFLGRHA